MANPKSKSSYDDLARVLTGLDWTLNLSVMDYEFSSKSKSSYDDLARVLYGLERTLNLSVMDYEFSFKSSMYHAYICGVLHKFSKVYNPLYFIGVSILLLYSSTNNIPPY